MDATQSEYVPGTLLLFSSFESSFSGILEIVLDINDIRVSKVLSAGVVESAAFDYENHLYQTTQQLLVAADDYEPIIWRPV